MNTQSARAISQETGIVIIDKADGSVVERINLVRYAGYHRAEAVEGFVVRNDAGKVRVRSDRDLGLSDESSKVAYVADTFDTQLSA